MKMADINVLKEKVEKAQEKVNKCKGTIERHKKQLEKKIKSGAHPSDIEFKEDDIKGAEKKLKDAEKVLSNWEEKLNIKINEQKFIEDNAPQVIKDFLEEWKQLAYQWYINKYNKYQEFKAELENKHDTAIIEFVEGNPKDFERYLEDGKIKEYWMNDLINIRGRSLSAYMKERRLDYLSIKRKREEFAGSIILYMDSIYNEAERLEWLNKTLESDKQAKLLDMVYRITGVVGEITDASNLQINDKGNIDGIVIGKKGKAKIETIGAGGWNIQVFHYRTLVHEIK